MGVGFLDEVPIPYSEREVSSPSSQSDPLSQWEDARLIERVLAGEGWIFKELMQRYSSMVLGYLYGKAKTEGDCEDILQETFYTAYDRLGTLKTRERFGPWVMKIARHKRIDFQRKQFSRPQLVNLDDQAAAIERQYGDLSSGASPGPVEVASHAEIKSLVTEALGKMSDHYRPILYMRLIGEETPLEIAQHLGLKESTVRMRLMRGLKKLRATLIRAGVSIPGSL